MSNDNTDTPIEEENTVQTTSAKDKILTFFNQYSKEVLIVGVILLVIITAILLFFALNKKTMDDFADDFCDCASVTEGAVYYSYSDDKFGYRSDLKGCFADEFERYGKDFNQVKKKELLLEFQKSVAKKCPKKLANVFEYK